MDQPGHPNILEFRTTLLTDDFIQLPSGVKLEANLSSAPQQQTSALTKLAICLHPWSWLGGQMRDPVLRTVKDHLLSKGYYVLRYNSRGVGRSSGWPSLTGKQEAEDLRELVSCWALPNFPNIASLVILGYSHGSLIASCFPLIKEHPSIRISHILLSYPLGPRSWLTAFRGAHYTATLNALLHDPQARVLVIYSDHDDFTGVGSYDNWVDSLRNEAGGVEGGPQANLEVMKIEDANHFWTNDEARHIMLRCIREWVP
ncbi:alpha/beta-hydrolase [Irpex rosettiformis]|uniref:Alpha/beta-hydrolase n=1 Tax=Irpex rosettiformis TaxID=378272 RepID=A0ACB8U9I3_9APHY|nr:alpha/beta-hydrolase [Irpex rosettiformis]